MNHLLAELSPILLRACPAIASALGGPLAGIAVSLISSAIGVNNDPKAIVAKVMEDVPASENILQSLESQHAWFFSAVKNVKSLEINLKINLNDEIN